MYRTALFPALLVVGCFSPEQIEERTDTDGPRGSTGTTSTSGEPSADTVTTDQPGSSSSSATTTLSSSSTGADETTGFATGSDTSTGADVPPRICGDSIAAPGHHCYGEVTQIENSEFIVCMGAGDTNSDGNPDVVFGQEGVAVAVALGDGRGNFGPPLILESLPPSICILRDFDADGSLEMGGLVNSFGLWRISSTTTLQLAAADVVSPRLFATPDFNGDGTLDVAVGTRPLNAPTRVIPLIATPALDALTVTPGRIPGDTLVAIASGDLNNDSFEDVVWISASEGSPRRIGAMLGTPNGDPPVGLDVVYEAPVGIDLLDLAIANVSGDEALDIVFIQDDVVSILEGDGLLGFSAVEQIAAIGNPIRIVAAETDGTDTPEAVLLYGNLTQLSIMDEDNGTPTLDELSLPAAGMELDVADVNEDGVDDFLVASVGDGPVLLVLSDL